MSARAFSNATWRSGRTNPATLWLALRIERGLGNNAAAQQLRAAPEDRISERGRRPRSCSSPSGIRDEMEPAAQRRSRSRPRTPEPLTRRENCCARARASRAVGAAGRRRAAPGRAAGRGDRSRTASWCWVRRCTREGHLRKYASAAGPVAGRRSSQRYRDAQRCAGGADADSGRDAARRARRASSHVEAAVVDRRCDGRRRRLAWLVFELLDAELRQRRRSDSRRAEPVDGAGRASRLSRPRTAASRQHAPAPVAQAAVGEQRQRPRGEVRLRLEFTRAVVGRDLRRDGQAPDVRHRDSRASVALSPARRRCESSSALASAVNVQVNDRPIVDSAAAGQGRAQGSWSRRTAR